jgi:nucleolar protein 58
VVFGSLQGIWCLYDDLVMEMMWGMKNLMRSLVPQEQKVLTMEERLPMSKGLEMILRQHNFDVKPEMVSLITACL